MAEEKDYKAQAEKDIAEFGKRIEEMSKNARQGIAAIVLSASLSGVIIKEDVKSLEKDFTSTCKRAGKSINDDIKEAIVHVCDKGESGIKSLAVSGLGCMLKLKDNLKDKFSKIDLFSSTMELGKKGISAMITLSKSLGNAMSKAVSSAVGLINYDWNSLAKSFSGSDGAKDKAEKMKTNSDGINNSVTSIKAGLFNTVADPLVDATDQVNKIISGISSTFLEKGVPALGEALVTGVSQILDVINGMLPKFIDSITEVIMSVTAAINEYLSSDETSSGIIGAASGILTTFVTGILEVLPSLIDTGLLIVQTLLQAIEESIPNLIPVAEETLTQIITTLTDNLPSILEAGIQILVSLIDGITEMIPTLIPLAMDFITKIAGTITDNLPTIITSGINLLTALIGGISEMLPNLIPLALDMILNIVNTILGNLDKIIASAVQLVLALVQGILNALPKLISEFPKMIITICTTIINNLPNIINAAINIIGALISGLISAIPQLVGSIPQIISAIVGAFANADWGSIGSNIIRGIGNALSSGVSWLLDIVGNLCSDLFEKVTGFFDIHSPSRLMRDAIGKNIVRGIGVGMDVEAPNLLSIAEENMQDLVSKMKSTVEFESMKMAGGIGSINRYADNLSSIVNNNDNGIVQNITITQPVKSPSETARAIRRAGRELAFG